MLQINQRSFVEKKREIKLEKPDVESLTSSPFYDPNIGLQPSVRNARALRFVEPGRFEAQAEKLRTQVFYDQYASHSESHLFIDCLRTIAKEDKRTCESCRRRGRGRLVRNSSDSCMISWSKQLYILILVYREPVPEIEWWDAPLLNGHSYDVLDTAGFSEAVITNLIQHPVSIAPPKKPILPQKVILTKEEQKKLRRQRRMADEKAKQEKVQMGLVPPPPPRLTVNNVPRVMPQEFIQDPTRAEAEARRQMAARLSEHLRKNEERKLTPEQRREKKAAKFKQDAERELFAAVFRIKDLAHPQKKYKVDINAQQLFLSGIALLFPGMNVVIVEGGAKAIRKYEKLMLHRIHWDRDPPPLADGADPADSEEDAENGDAHHTGNACHLVWKGNIRRPAFKGFRLKTIKSDFDATEFLKRGNIEHYWHICKNFIPPEDSLLERPQDDATLSSSTSSDELSE